MFIKVFVTLQESFAAWKFNQLADGLEDIDRKRKDLNGRIEGILRAANQMASKLSRIEQNRLLNVKNIFE